MQNHLPTQTEEIDRDAERQLYLSSRRPPRNDAAVFVENHVTLGSQPSLAVFSRRVDSFVPVEEAKRHDQKATSMWEEANGEINDLFDLMVQVQAKYTGPVPATTAMVSSKASKPPKGLLDCTWNDVMAEVQVSANSWKKRPSRDSRIIGFIDKVGQNSKALEAWIGLLPAGDYGSSICGVFKLALNAASQYDKIQTTVLETLSEIPGIMDTATRYVQIYYKMTNQILEQRTYELFRAILKTLRLVMQFFLDGKRKKILGPLFKQESYGSELSSSVDDIKKCVERVNTEADICNRRQTAAIGPILLEMRTETSQNNELQNQTLAHVYHGVIDDDEDLLGLSLRQSQREEMETRKAAVERLRGILQYDPEAISRDILRVIRDGHQLSYRAKSRGSALVNNSMFKEFMTVAASASLLVNGREDTAAADGISPLSMVVAEVLSSIGGSGAQVFPLSHFCDSRRPGRLLRSDGKMPEYAPLADMAASLVGQLLGLMEGRGIQPEVPSIVGEHQWGALGKLKIKTLIKTLGALVKQLPPDSIVICAIDDVGEYETGALSAKLQDVMRLLTRLTEGDTGSVVFKLLVTCRNRALDVGRFFGRTLEMEEGIEEDTSADWTLSRAGEWEVR
ncbi:hypothetical protein F5X68DRAFT_278047 [Plectosphaerella plurivora]|uniref:DUF7708 domain-containing protein n=1 Tax=Plectosphaerella plurivora TaxID=936078 RepID=A0A9P9A5U2_9PEZI|nr:hypothetical protein F5X68DRAFT_278047 [Plectosphaerella plurivora]